MTFHSKDPHCTETWNIFSIVSCCLGLMVWGQENSPAQPGGGAWYELKNEEEGGLCLLSLPTFPLITKLQPTKFSGHSSSCPPTCKFHKHPTLINPFLSTTLLSLNSSLHWDRKDYGTGALRSPPCQNDTDLFHHGHLRRPSCNHQGCEASS